MPAELSKRASEFFKGPLILLYVTYFWATWGNRMWNFALGLFLVVLADGQLRLTAIFGFLMGVSVLVFGSFIGNWVDKTNRRTAVRTSILLQKSAVIICSIAICGTFIFYDKLNNIANGTLIQIVHGVVIILAILAELATMSYQRMELEKDWFVVVTDGDEGKLANLNAGTRIVDQITNIVTPIVTGLIMSSVSKVIAGLVIIGWHIVAIIVEITLVSRIYSMMPAMQQKTNERNQVNHVNVNGQTTAEEKSLMGSKENRSSDIEGSSRDEKDTSGRFCKAVSSLWTGWRIYAQQTVVLAGASLALLYMTVLGFDGITTGYIYANGLSESLIGIATAMSSIAGVIGALLYTQLHRCLGLERTGLVSFTFQISCLCFCLLSIWMPGSPFQPDALWNQFSNNYSPVTTDSSNFTLSTGAPENTTVQIIEDGERGSVTPSIVMFVIAIVTSRIGLWVSDLVICQLQQENVPESARGTVNGVQNSLNNLMDMLKFILVIFLPKIETFGYLIMLSFTSVFCGVLTFYMHCFKASEYSLVRCCTGKKSSKPPEQVTYVSPSVDETV